MPTDYRAIWDALNERQQHYLKALYTCDQQIEQGRKYDAARGDYDNTPASEWRWINYDRLVGFGKDRHYGSMLWEAIGDKWIDSGTGSTWEALNTRGLIEKMYAWIGDNSILWCKMTMKGRKVVRSALPEEEKPFKLPKGALSRHSWAALKIAYENSPLKPDSRSDYGGVYWPVWVRLRDRKPPLIALTEGRGQVVNGLWRMVEPRLLYITDAGRQFYQEKLDVHRELYPELY